MASDCMDRAKLPKEFEMDMTYRPLLASALLVAMMASAPGSNAQIPAVPNPLGDSVATVCMDLALLTQGNPCALDYLHKQQGPAVDCALDDARYSSSQTCDESYTGSDFTAHYGVITWCTRACYGYSGATDGQIEETMRDSGSYQTGYWCVKVTNGVYSYPCQGEGGATHSIHGDFAGSGSGWFEVAAYENDPS